ncbi:hypothetical protein A1F99_126710, partial [Pyrenophora tritici-repentis]
MVLDNDTRGWIMTAVSGIACTFGGEKPIPLVPAIDWAKGRLSSIICVDVVVRLFPGKKNFKIENSNAFLSTGLSLSFGVM